MSANTALGDGALVNNTTGDNNTAIGAQALKNNTSGTGNTTIGFAAMEFNISGGNNTAIGSEALEKNNDGIQNTAVGAAALGNNASGNANTAVGLSALNQNTKGGANTGIGTSALELTNGENNTAVGAAALLFSTTGNNNIALGVNAGRNVTEGSDNIHIGSQGSARDSSGIWIGTPGTQSACFVAGVRSVTTSQNDAIPVVIDSNGQLGTVNSSRRFKEDIQDMGEASRGLLHLRPVAFRYQKPFADGSKPMQYGLIAEEVAEVYPDLVARSADGQIEAVKYQVLDAMLLNELQRQAQQNRQQADKIHSLESRLAALEERRA